MQFLGRILLTIIFGALFVYIVLNIKPPKSWVEASIFQILLFFIPLLLFLTSFINIFLNYAPKAFILSLGMIMLLVFQGAKQLNLFSAMLIILITIITFRIFPKFNYRFLSKSGFKPDPKIPRLNIFRKKTQLD